MAVYQQSYPTLSEAAYNNLFRYSNAPGQPTNPLVGSYQQVTDAANRAHIPPSLFASIIAQETGFGRYLSGQTGGGRIYTHNNPAGIMDPATRHRQPMRYGSFQEGLDAAADTAARIYRRGGTILPTVQNIYAPTDPQPANDPHGLNRAWLPNVTRFLRNIAGTMSPSDYEALQPGLLAADQEQLLAPMGQAADISRAAGYELPPGVQDFLDMTAPELGGGPGSFDPNSPFPWHNPGRIGEDVGAVLQHHALMPNNLIYNPDTQVWDVPSTQRFPGATGIWGAESVANWLPEARETRPGFGVDYLTHLGYGADPLAGQNLWPTVPGYGGGANVATGGVDLAHWIARQFGGGGGGGSQIWPQWDPNISSGSSGNLGGNVWDATPWYQQWDPNISSGPSGNRGGTVWDASPSTPEFGPGFSVNPSTYDIYRSTTGLPSGGFDPQPIPQGLGYEGSHGITTIDPGILQLGQDINRHAQSMINQGYNQAYNFNQQNQVFAQQNQAPNNGWSYAPNLVNFNPQLSFGTANAFQ